jgi:LCP family protein required for cell wall assembly
MRRLTLVALSAILGLAAVTMPDSAIRQTDMALVKTSRATTVDTDPDVLWILAAGSDARPGEEPTRTRADALQLIAIDTRTGAASAVGIPRDSYVSIPGSGSDRVNAAMAYGGPQLLADTVGTMFGVQPDYVFVASFASFKALIDDLDGIEVNNPRFFSDDILKPQGFAKGRIELGAYTALQFSRVRKSLPGGDFDRSANQQLVIRGIQAKIRANASASGWLDRRLVTAMAALDTSASPAEMYRLARAIASLKPSRFTTCVLTGALATINGASVVLPSLTDARRYGEEARADATIDRC